jgi:RNA polymerase sigma-70 factor (ECF subfamily)
MVTHQQQDAEDAVQAALTKLAGQPRLLANVELPWPYLLRIVRNEALVIGRRNAKVRLSDDLSDMLTYCRVDELEREDTYRQIWSALRQLPVEQSEVIALKIWESMTFVQIAEILDISANTAASRYRYGVSKLSTVLRPHRESSYA